MLTKPTMRIVGIVLFVIGFIIRYAIGRRKFYRRTMTGRRFSNHMKTLGLREL